MIHALGFLIFLTEKIILRRKVYPVGCFFPTSLSQLHFPLFQHKLGFYVPDHIHRCCKSKEVQTLLSVLKVRMGERVQKAKGERIREVVGEGSEHPILEECV